MNVEKLKLAWTPCTYVHCSSFIMTRVFITCLASHWKTHRQTLVTTADVPADIPRRRHPPPPEDTLKAAAAKKILPDTGISQDAFPSLAADLFLLLAQDEQLQLRPQRRPK